MPLLRLASRLFCLVGLLLLWPDDAPAQRVLSTQDQLIEFERQWNDAFYEKDVSFIETLLADDFTAVYDNGSSGDKTRELELTRTFDQQVLSAVQDDFTVRVYGDTAVVWFLLNLTGNRQGQRTEVRFRYTDVWVMRAGKWQCVSTHSTKVTAN